MRNLITSHGLRGGFFRVLSPPCSKENLRPFFLFLPWAFKKLPYLEGNQCVYSRLFTTVRCNRGCPSLPSRKNRNPISHMKRRFHWPHEKMVFFLERNNRSDILGSPMHHVWSRWLISNFDFFSFFEGMHFCGRSSAAAFWPEILTPTPGVLNRARYYFGRRIESGVVLK